MLGWSVSSHWTDVRGCCSFIEQSAAVMAAHRAGNCRRGATRPAIGIARRMQLGTGAAWLPRALWGASGLPWSSTANETELAHTSGNGCAPRERVCPQGTGVPPAAAADLQLQSKRLERPRRVHAQATRICRSAGTSICIGGSFQNTWPFSLRFTIIFWAGVSFSPQPSSI